VEIIEEIQHDVNGIKSEFLIDSGRLGTKETGKSPVVLQSGSDDSVPRRRNQLGLLVRRFRIEAGWGQRVLAEKLRLAGLSISQPTIAYIESGKRSLLDRELQLFLDIFGKDWSDVARDGLEPTRLSKPRGKRKHHFGRLVRRFRDEVGLSQEKLAVRLQIAGWDVCRTVIMRIESGERPIFDYELELILRVLGKDWDNFFKK